jgi:molybdopterin/thiamine biosynthesis adenylyltransferase
MDTATTVVEEADAAIEHDYSNQTDIFDPDQHAWPVNFIGLGGIGSQMVLQIAKLGVTSINLYDDDDVELHNLPYQMYRPCDIGKPKAQAMADILRSFGYTNVNVNVGRVDSTTGLEGIVIAGVDSMESRRAIWDAVQFNPQVILFMDGRLGGEHVQLYTLNPCDPEAVDRYEATFFDDADAAPLPCAARAVIHPAMNVATMVVSQITNFTRGRRIPFSIITFTPDFEVFAFE